MFSRPYRFSHLTVALVWLCLTSCSHQPKTETYQAAYAHLEEPIPTDVQEEYPDYHVTFLVSARHFDYSNCKSLISTMVKNPVDGCKNGSVGHAWILLRGIEDGETVTYEGGHSGETGEEQPKYFDGIMNYVQYGYLDPTDEEKKRPRVEPNPIKYLWAIQTDGYFQNGNGGFGPSFAAMVPISEKQYYEIKEFFDPENYDYREYAITHNQCSDFVARVGALIDFPIEYQVEVPVDSMMKMGGQAIQMWEDPQYSKIGFASPDIVEKSLMEAVREGRAIYAVDWYYERFPERRKSSFQKRLENVYMFPSRISRYLLLR